MKKILTVFAALALVACLVSCNKENIAGNGNGETNKTTITATFAELSKVTYSENGNDLQPSWEEGDKVLGLTSDGTPFELTVVSINSYIATLEGENVPSGAVTLIYVSGVETTDYDYENNKYVISYNAQNGDKTMPAIMTANGTIDNESGEFTFYNDGAVLGISNVGTALNGKAIKQVTLYGTGIASKAEITYDGVAPVYANNGYNVISTKILEGITVAANGDLNENILMAVPAGAEVDSVFIRTTEGEVYSLGSSNKGPMTASTYRYIKNADFKRDAYRDDMILTGVFSTDENGEKQVFFSKGNLYYDGSKFDFEANQYEFHGYDSANNTWGLFGWVGASSTAFIYSPEIYGASTNTTSENYGDDKTDALKADWGEAIGDGKIWYTPSKEDWESLVAYYAEEEGDFRYGFTKPAVTVCGKANSVVIAPDGWDLTANPLQAEYNSTSTPMTWEEAEAAGLVCLPAAGNRTGDVVSDEIGKTGYYWSKTAAAKASKANEFDFDNKDVDFTDSYRYVGCSVRLVSECK